MIAVFFWLIMLSTDYNDRTVSLQVLLLAKDIPTCSLLEMINRLNAGTLNRIRWELIPN